MQHSEFIVSGVIILMVWFFVSKAKITRHVPAAAEIEPEIELNPLEKDLMIKLVKLREYDYDPVDAEKVVQQINKAGATNESLWQRLNCTTIELAQLLRLTRVNFLVKIVNRMRDGDEDYAPSEFPNLLQDLQRFIDEGTTSWEELVDYGITKAELENIFQESEV